MPTAASTPPSLDPLEEALEDLVNMGEIEGWTGNFDRFSSKVSLFVSVSGLLVPLTYDTTSQRVVVGGTLDVDLDGLAPAIRTASDLSPEQPFTGDEGLDGDLGPVIEE